MVSSFGDGDLVEGYDPDVYYDAWREFERIDAMTGEDGKPLGKTERDRLKRDYLASHGMRAAAPAGGVARSELRGFPKLRQRRSIMLGCGVQPLARWLWRVLKSTTLTPRS